MIKTYGELCSFLLDHSEFWNQSISIRVDDEIYPASPEILQESDILDDDSLILSA